MRERPTEPRRHLAVVALRPSASAWKCLGRRRPLGALRRWHDRACAPTPIFEAMEEMKGMIQPKDDVHGARRKDHLALGAPPESPSPSPDSFLARGQAG